MIRRRLLTLASAMALAVPAVVWAQSAGQPGYYEGYQRGELAGSEDFRRGDTYQFTDESDYRRGDVGYRSEFGNRDRYRESFRVGFQTGYRDGFYRVQQQFPGRGGVPPWSNGRGNAYGRGRFDTAFQQGVNDGYTAGLNDARGRRRYDPISESRYRSADRGYNSQYGSKPAYQNRYREGFKQGYESGYTDERRYNGSGLGGFLGRVF